MADCQQIWDDYVTAAHDANEALEEARNCNAEYDELLQLAHQVDADMNQLEVMLLDLNGEIEALRAAAQQERQQRIAEIDAEIAAIDARLLEILAELGGDYPPGHQGYVDALWSEAGSLNDRRNDLLAERDDLTSENGVPADVQASIDQLTAEAGETRALLAELQAERAELSSQMEAAFRCADEKNTEAGRARYKANELTFDYDEHGCTDELGPLPEVEDVDDSYVPEADTDEPEEPEEPEEDEEDETEGPPDEEVPGDEGDGEDEVEDEEAER